MKAKNQTAVLSAPAISAVERKFWHTFVATVSLALVQLTAFATQTITLAWNPSSDTNVVGYKIYYGTIHGIYSNVVPVGNVTNTAIPGLVEGVSYCFTATAFNNVGGESSFSNETSYTIPNGAVLAINGVRTNGILAAVTVTAGGSIPFRWALQSSSNLNNWATLARGTNSPVNVSTAVNNSSRRFFRLKSE